MFSSYNRLIIYFVSGLCTDVLVSLMMRHLLLSYSHVLKWLLPVYIVIIMIVFFWLCLFCIRRCCFLHLLLPNCVVLILCYNCVIILICCTADEDMC